MHAYLSLFFTFHLEAEKSGTSAEKNTEPPAKQCRTPRPPTVSHKSKHPNYQWQVFQQTVTFSLPGAKISAENFSAFGATLWYLFIDRKIDALMLPVMPGWVRQLCIKKKSWQKNTLSLQREKSLIVYRSSHSSWKVIFSATYISIYRFGILNRIYRN